MQPYVTCSLYHPAIDGNEKRKTSHYRPHHHKSFFGKEQPPATSPVWEPAERLEWTYDARDGDFAFLRLLIKSDDAFAKNPAFLTTSVRLVSVPNGAWDARRAMPGADRTPMRLQASGPSSGQAWRGGVRLT